MGSVFIPVDKCTKENSCLQVLSSSHLMGRINHSLTGDQAGADPERYKKRKLEKKKNKETLNYHTFFNVGLKWLLRYFHECT